MKLRIPYLKRTEQHHADPLRRIIERMANKMCCSEPHAAMMITHFLEGVACEVSMGQCVRIPGFGVFGPYTWESRSKVDRGELSARPYFYPAQAFRQEVKASCPVHSKGEESAKRYGRNNTVSNGGKKRATRMRVFTAMHEFRQAIANQADALGIDPYDAGS